VTVTRLLAYASEAAGALWRNRGRSLLTMLGMVVGTSSVIAVLGLGRAASGGITNQLRAFGDPGFIVSANQQQNDPLAASPQFRDAAIVAARNADVFTHVFPLYSRNYHMAANGVDFVGNVTSDSDYITDSLSLREGRRFTANDVASSARVCNLSQSVERRLFGDGAYSLGKTVRINGIRFAVVGVYDDLHASIFANSAGTEYIAIPYTTFGAIAPGPVDQLDVYARPGVGLPLVRERAFSTLHRLHGPDAQYDVQDALAFVSGFERTIGLVGTGLAGIGGVALVVAGIGIMNIMLVSVAERTREIGLRKAIGGSRRDIALQFLMEAIMLSLGGGVLGTAIGVAFVLAAASVVAGLLGPASIPWTAILSVALGFSLLVGVAFGTYPALRAGALDPIEALRS